jgi:hypothetical protein
MSDEKVSLSDYYVVAVLSLLKVPPLATKLDGNRLWFDFPANKTRKVLTNYEMGNLRVQARDFVAAIKMTKDKIFNAERAARLKSVA